MPTWFTSLSDERLAAYAAVFAGIVALAIPIVQSWWAWVARPLLVVDFENRPRWRRKARKLDSRADSLFIRVRVANKGWSVARGVAGRMVEMLEWEGGPVESFDPAALHWAGTEWGTASTSRLALHPGQEEFLDVICVDGAPYGGSSMQESAFSVMLHDQTPRGIQTTHNIRGQTLRVLVSADNAEAVGLELQLPLNQAFASRFLSLKHRPVDRFGLGLYPWDEQPPTKVHMGMTVAGIDAGFSTTGISTPDSPP